MDIRPQERKSFFKSQEPKAYFTFLRFSTAPELTSLEEEKANEDLITNLGIGQYRLSVKNYNVETKDQRERIKKSQGQSKKQKISEEEDIKAITQQSEQKGSSEQIKHKIEIPERDENEGKHEKMGTQSMIGQIKAEETEKIQKSGQLQLVPPQQPKISNKINQQQKISQKKQQQQEPINSSVQPPPFPNQNSISSKQDMAQNVATQAYQQKTQKQQNKACTGTEQSEKIMTPRVVPIHSNEKKEGQEKEEEYIPKRQQNIQESKTEIFEQIRAKGQFDSFYHQQTEKRQTSIYGKNNSWFYDLGYSAGSYLHFICSQCYRLVQREIRSNQFVGQWKQQLSEYQAEYLLPLSKLYSTIPGTLTTAKYEIISDFTINQRTMILSLSSVSLGIFTYKYSNVNLIKRILYSTRNTAFAFAVGGLLLLPEIFHPFVRMQAKYPQKSAE